MQYKGVMSLFNLEICVLGNLTINVNKKSISGSISNKAAALLCYLVLNKDKTFSRDKLASIFWDSASIETARYNLRYTLWSLRKVLDADKKQTPVIVAYKDCCRINPEALIYLDVFEMERLLEESRQLMGQDLVETLSRAKSIYKGEFLEGFYINKCPEFNDWVFFERERLQRKHFDVLHRLTKLHKSAGNYHKSIEILNEMLKINPLQEELYEELIKNYLELGDRASALKQYKRCSNILRDELNLSPNENIRKLYNEIKNTNKNSRKADENPIDPTPYRQLKILFIEENKLREKPEEQILCDKLLLISTVCHSAVQMPYTCLSDCIAGIIEKADNSLLEKLPRYYWKDLCRIESAAYKFCADETPLDSLTAISEKIRIFKAFENLLNTVSAEVPMRIYIKSIQCIDRISLEFLKFFVCRNKSSNITLVLEGSEIDAESFT